MVVVLMILLFGLLVFLHELGHFVAARLSGVQVNEFAIFMGPALVKWQRGETVYSIRCIPFGGFCAMEGEDEENDNPRSFHKVSKLKQFFILFSGPAMNFIAGFVLCALFMIPVKQVDVPVISYVEPGCTVVSEDGLHNGDRILKVDGERVYCASDFSTILFVNGGDVHDIVVERDGEKVVLEDLKMEKHLFGQEETPRYGFSFTMQEATFGAKVKYTFQESVNAVRTVIWSLEMLFNGQAGVQDLSSPVGIVKGVSDATKDLDKFVDELLSCLSIGAFISINLGVMNLLPIPAVDGGRIFGLVVTAAIEKITGKKVNPKYEGYIHTAGFVLLMGLMIFVLGKDIWMLFQK